MQSYHAPVCLIICQALLASGMSAPDRNLLTVKGKQRKSSVPSSVRHSRQKRNSLYKLHNQLPEGRNHILRLILWQMRDPDRNKRTRILVLLNKGIRCKTGTRQPGCCAVSAKIPFFLRKQVIGRYPEKAEWDR